MALSRSGTSNSQRLQQQRQLIQQLKELRKVSSAQRVGEWCTAVTRAMLDQPEKLKGVVYKCNDNVTVGAHRFVLGVQSTYETLRSRSCDSECGLHGFVLPVYRQTNTYIKFKARPRSVQGDTIVWDENVGPVFCNVPYCANTSHTPCSKLLHANSSC